MQTMPFARALTARYRLSRCSALVRFIVLAAWVVCGVTDGLAAAASTVASPAAAPAEDETLLETTLPLSALPISPLIGVWAGFTYRVWAPGAEAILPAVPNKAADVLCVVAGTLTTTVDGESAVIQRRAESSALPVEKSLAPGDLARLLAGDCMRQPMRTAVTVRNLGADDLTLLQITTWSRPEPQGNPTLATRDLGWVDIAAWTEAAVPRLAVRLDRVILDPGEFVTPPPAGSLQTLAPETLFDGAALAEDAHGRFNHVDRAVPTLVVTVAPHPPATHHANT